MLLYYKQIALLFNHLKAAKINRVWPTEAKTRFKKLTSSIGTCTARLYGTSNDSWSTFDYVKIDLLDL